MVSLGLQAESRGPPFTAVRKWYAAARQLRVNHETALEEEAGSGSSSSGSSSDADADDADRAQRLREAEGALRGLRIHELMAFGMCFFGPAAATYLLYFVRELLDRPSDGLVSNFNLTIFLLSAEIPPCAHGIDLVLSHTLHLQRIVQSNPYRLITVTPEMFTRYNQRMNAMQAQLDDLQTAQSSDSDSEPPLDMDKLRKDLIKDARAALQPEIDSLSRMIRRHEKHTNAMFQDLDRRLKHTDGRLDDAATLAAVAAATNGNANNAGNASHAGTMGWIVNNSLYVATLPMRITFVMPFQLLGWMLGRNSKDALRLDPPCRVGETLMCAGGFEQMAETADDRG